MTQIEQWLREEGLKEGKREGETAKVYEVARVALLKGADAEFVAQITGLPLDTIQKLKTEI